MLINRNYEPEIRLRDLLFHILYKWRIILLVGLIIAGILGFREYWSFEKYHRNGELTPAEIKFEVDVEENRKALEQAEKNLSEFESVLKDSNSLQMSLLMGIDPTSIWTAEKKYYLNNNLTRDNTDDEVVSAEPVDSKIFGVLLEAFSVDIDSAKLMEIFGTDARRDIDEMASISINPVLKTLSVVGCGSTKEEAIKRKEFVDSYFSAAVDKLPKSEEYMVEVLSDSVGTRLFLTGRNAKGEREEKDLALMQSNISAKYQNYQNQISVYTQTRNNLLAKTFVKPTPKILSQALFGFAFGAFVVIVISVVVYLLNGKLKTGRELRNRYDVAILSDMTHSRAWWKGKGIDWILEKLEFGKKTDWENELDSIAYLVDEAKDGKTVLLTGSLEEKRLKKIYEGLSSRLQKQGIELIFEPDYLHNSEAVASSRDLDSVLLVEEKYVSRVRDLNRMAEMLEIEDANVIGVVLI